MENTINTSLSLIPRDEHCISRKLISPSALKVIHRLNENGFEAYLVGGGVRDILLGQHPKDFDVSTDAHPEQVHKLFRNSRLIGRRFKIVHILFGREIIEVATFRGHSESEESSQKNNKKASNQHKQSEDGMLLRDNVYGTIEDDVVRRDFTANALYYSPKDFCVYDYLDACKDLEDRKLKLIGEPEQRYREDPVRMLRALRFKSKLDFEIEDSAKKAIYEYNELIVNVSAARLFDEMIKLFVSGYGFKIYEDLQEFGLFSYLFPSTQHALQHSEKGELYKRLVAAGLKNTDARVQVEKPVTPGFLYAFLLWPEVDRYWQQALSEGIPEFPALQQASQKAIQAQLQTITIPKRFSLMMKDVWEMQIRLKKTHGKAPKLLLSHPKFRAGYDFLLLREQAGEKLDGLGDWWTKFQQKHPELVQSGKRSSKGPVPANKRPSGRRRRRPSSRPKKD